MPPSRLSLLNPLPTAPLVENNTSRRYLQSNTAMVFVHGVLSSSAACWFNEKSNTYWPDLVGSDPLFKDVAIYTGGYHTSVESSHYSVRECAEQLFDRLHESAYSPDTNGTLPSVASHDRIIFVCHSLGGIVVRFLLVNYPDIFQHKKIGLLLVASPSMGSAYATWLGLLSKALNHDVARLLKEDSDFLTELDYRFDQLIKTPPYSSIHGLELAEHHMLVPGLLTRVGWLIRLRSPQIVPPKSALRYFDEPRKIPGSDHSSIAKPTNLNHDSHRQLQRFFTAFNQNLPSNAAPPLAVQVAGSSNRQLTCRDIFWQVLISEDGDALNRMEFLGVSSAVDGPEHAYRLPDGTVEPGETTPCFKAVGRSPGIQLVSGVAAQGNESSTRALFESPPSSNNPFDLVLEQGDVSSFAMDAQELRRSDPGDAGYDYVQKRLPFEIARRLLILLQFPKALQLKSVTVEGFRLIAKPDGTASETFDEQLTKDLANAFLYSPLLRSAALILPDPRSRSTFRVRWTLDNPTPPSDQSLARLRSKRRRLLAFRASFESAAKPKHVIEALADFASVTLDLLEEVAANVETLDLSLMVVDETAQGEVLRTCASLNDDRKDWDLEIPLGKGIAGRAARSLRPRTYAPSNDRYPASASEDMARRAYHPFTDRQNHAWLLSIPLWQPEECPRPLGVVNVGTFDPNQAAYLRALGTETTIARLAAYACGTLLRRLLTN